MDEETHEKKGRRRIRLQRGQEETRACAVVLTNAQWSWLTKRARALGWSRAALIRHLVGLGMQRIAGHDKEVAAMLRDATRPAKKLPPPERKSGVRFIERLTE
jgi:hypothetical protein